MGRPSISIIGLFFFIQLNAFGWGQIGHRVVGKVAENHLTDKAKANIKLLLGYETLADVSTWMDDIKSDKEYDHTHDWHWVTIPEGQTYSQTELNPHGDAVECINRMITILKTETAPFEEKRDALKYLVHLVGDLHQPLHVGKGDDKGGNDVKVKWFYQSSNLHRVWDSEMIESKQYSYTELATKVNHADAAQVAAWQKGSVSNWAEEAMTFRKQVYNTGDIEKMGYRYMYENWDLVQTQLEKAGVRLAGILNEIFG